MAPEYRNNNWIQNYFFVDFPVTAPRYVSRDKRLDTSIVRDTESPISNSRSAVYR